MPRTTHPEASPHPERPPFLPPGFLAWLERLELGARRVAPRGLRGRHRSRGLGGALEIADDRPYAPGDDLRAIDWAAYARLEQLLVRRFRRDQDLCVHVLLDQSASMATGGRALFSRQLAFAIAFVALSGDDRVRLGGFAEGRVHPAATARGRRRSAALLRHAATLSPEPVAGDLPKSLSALAAARPAPGLAVVLSDLLPLDPGVATALRQSLQRLRVAGLEPVVVQIAPYADAIVGVRTEGQATRTTKEGGQGQGQGQRQGGATQDAHSPHEPAAPPEDAHRTLGVWPTPWILKDAEQPGRRLVIGAASAALRKAVREVAAEHAARARAVCRELDVAFCAVPPEATLREAVLAFLRGADPRVLSSSLRKGFDCSSGR